MIVHAGRAKAHMRTGLASFPSPLSTHRANHVYRTCFSRMLHNANCIVFMQEELKAQLKAGLASLPAPSNDFEIVLPEVRCFSFIYCTHTWVMFSAVEISLK